MDNLVLMAQATNFYAYRNARKLPGRLRGAVVHSRVLERVHAAEDYLRRKFNARLLVLDSARPVVLQAALFLTATNAIRDERGCGLATAGQLARRRARNPAIDLDSQHLSGRAVDLLLADPRTGRPYADDLLRFDSWDSRMDPRFYDNLICANHNHPSMGRICAAAARELHVREACKAAGLIPSEVEFCQFECPDLPGLPFMSPDLQEFLVERVPYGMEADLMDRCDRLAAL